MSALDALELRMRRAPNDLTMNNYVTEVKTLLRKHSIVRHPAQGADDYTCAFCDNYVNRDTWKKEDHGKDCPTL